MGIRTRHDREKSGQVLSAPIYRLASNTRKWHELKHEKRARHIIWRLASFRKMLSNLRNWLLAWWDNRLIASEIAIGIYRVFLCLPSKLTYKSIIEMLVLMLCFSASQANWQCQQ
jgi:hypothetical protein